MAAVADELKAIRTADVTAGSGPRHHRWDRAVDDGPRETGVLARHVEIVEHQKCRT